MHANESSEYMLVTVASGARSLRSLEHGETFHPVVGPMAEARDLHVTQSRLIERARKIARPLIVWDVGLGAAANAIAIIESFQGAGDCAAEIHSFDCTTSPLQFARAHADELGYLAPYCGMVDEFLCKKSARAGVVKWHLWMGDFRELVSSPPAPAPDAILYDPYSPAANPGMWSLEHFYRLRRILDSHRPCTLTSYSRSTSVRVTLALANFYVGKGLATGEKSETTVAASHRELLDECLGGEWLARVARSTRGAPWREGAQAGRISEADYEVLCDVVAAWDAESRDRNSFASER